MLFVLLGVLSSVFANDIVKECESFSDHADELEICTRHALSVGHVIACKKARSYRKGGIACIRSHLSIAQIESCKPFFAYHSDKSPRIDCFEAERPVNINNACAELSIYSTVRVACLKNVGNLQEIEVCKKYTTINEQVACLKK